MTRHRGPVPPYGARRQRSFGRLLRTVVPTVVLAAFSVASHAQSLPKPRIVVSSDFPPIDVIPGGLRQGPPEKRSDPDDVQSMVRFLAYANEFRVEGLIAAAGTVANVADKRHLLDMLDRYEQVEGNLRLHDPSYPTAAALRRVTVQGLPGTYGRPSVEILGEGKDSEASAFLLRLFDQPDETPLWLCFWGGTQELAQALWRARRERPPAEFDRLLAKLRVYSIARQDGTAQWLLDQFPGLFMILSQRAFRGMVFTSPGTSPASADLPWLNAHVRQNHGPLGSLYPPSGWNPNAKGVVEGDSPSFLHVLGGAIGLTDPEQPSFGGWGGRFQPEGSSGRHWADAPEGAASVSRWHNARQRDFAARMDWCVKPPREANHAPLAVLNQDRTRKVLHLQANPGQPVPLSARGSSDPDGHPLTYNWWVYRDAGTFAGEATLQGATRPTARLLLPTAAQGTTLHVILEVTDGGTPALTSYRRMVVSVAASSAR